MVTQSRIAETAFVTPDEMRYLKDVFEASVADRKILRASDDALRLAAFIMETFGRRSMEVAAFLEAVRLFDTAQSELLVPLPAATKVLLANSGIRVREDGKLTVAQEVAAKVEAGDARNEGRAAYRSDPIQGSLSNPYPQSGTAHQQWAVGMNEKIIEATLARNAGLIMSNAVSGPNPADEEGEMLTAVQHVSDVVERVIDGHCERDERTERRQQTLTAQSAVNAAARQAKRRPHL